MLQYPVQLPPLSLSSSPKIPSKQHAANYLRSNDARPAPTPLNNRRLQVDGLSPRPAYHVLSQSPAFPLSISTNQATPSSTSSSPSATSFKLPRSPYISSRQLPSPVSQTWSPNFISPVSDRSPSAHSSTIEDVLSTGDIVGEGCALQGETIRLVSMSDAANDEDPAKEFQVVRQLGTGSYAVVYLVREILYRSPPSEDGHMLDPMDMEGSARPSTVYGREYAIKCLSKANLDEEALAAQMSEVTIHQSLRPHPNIVTLHRTLETSSFLLLLLEYVPGEDLFYFLEQARDHYETDNPASDDSLPVSTSRTPPTPSLLSTLNPAQLLSRTRLRLISSMFSQMCDAVAACHAQQVFHRDIKPENFIVTDGYAVLPDGSRERKVIVKLTDFGLSTTDLQSSDMDCGSAPYMSYECRNNIAPTYSPRAADVWSLGIVLINMLYHYNPWTDTSHGTCSSFDLFCQQPISFFMHRFTGMTRSVAEFLANEVFCLLDDPKDDSQRTTASEFGAWVRDLPALLGDHSGFTPPRATSAASTQGHPLSQSVPLSHRPSSRQASGTPAMRTPAMQSRSLSRAPSLGPTYENEASELSTVYDQEVEEDAVDSVNSRSPSTNKRRKRGRKGKGINSPTTPQDETLATLAVASQSLAREISKASKSSSTKTSTSSQRVRVPFEPVSMYAMPTPLLTQSKSPYPSLSQSSMLPSPTTPSTPTARVPVVAKKTSKWKLSFGKSAGGRVSPVEETTPPAEPAAEAPMSVTASNVTNLIKGLDAPGARPPPLQLSEADTSSTWTRGRRPKAPPSTMDDLLSAEHWSSNGLDSRSDRAISPNSTRSSIRPVASSASSMVSGNWRSSMSTSSANTSTSAFTRYSNSSTRSVSTTATSVSASSWRAQAKPPAAAPPVPALPKNIKFMTGTPWELDQLPRSMHPKGQTDFGSPPVRKKRARKPKELPLDTISERPAVKAPETQRTDASTSTTDLSGMVGDGEDGDGPRKVPKGQITALAKMLSALRR